MEPTDDVAHRLGKLADVKVNDAVKLAFLKNEQIEEIDKLDLFALEELRRNPGGVVELKFIDRLEVLKYLAQCLEENQDKTQELLNALGEEETDA